jgi:UMF1 family MFS transporter
VRKSLFLAIGIYMFITVWGVLMTKKYEFYVLAILIGTVQGGIQALSRSYYSRLIPKGQAGEFYGFYNMLGRFAAILGPALIGLVGLAAKWWIMPPAPSPAQATAVEQAASRWSMGSLMILFLVGGALLYFVDEEKGKREINRYEEQEA